MGSIPVIRKKKTNLMIKQRKKKQLKSFLHLFYDARTLKRKKYTFFKSFLPNILNSPKDLGNENHSFSYLKSLESSQENLPLYLTASHSNYPFKQKFSSELFRNPSPFLENSLSSSLVSSSQKQSRGKKRQILLSPAGQKLQTKRILSFLYGDMSHCSFLRFQRLLEKYTRKLSLLKPHQGIFLGKILERRLDIITSKMFFFDTLQNTRQFIQHKGILVNNKVVNLCSYLVNPGDIISIKNPELFLSRNPFFQNVAFLHSFFKKGIQSKNWNNLMFTEKTNSQFFKYPHLEVNYKILSGIFLYSPQFIYLPLHLKKSDG